MTRFLKWLLINDNSNTDPQADRTEPVISFRNFILDERVLNGTPFFRPSKKYVQDLQYCYEELMDYLGRNSLLNVDSLRMQYNLLHDHACELERMLAKTKGERDAMQIQLDSALKWQTERGRKNQVLTDNGYAPEEQREQQRDGRLFSNASGRSALDNKKLAAAMYQYGISKTDISQELEISMASLNVYLSEAKKHFFMVNRDGLKQIQFDSDYGNDLWNLDEMFDERWVDDDDMYLEEDEVTTLPGNMGEIHHGLEKPFING